MKIAVAGLGYVGLSNAVLLAQHHDVTAVDISAARVEKVNARQSPIIDREMEEFLANARLSLTATTDSAEAYRDADFVIVATPTNYDTETSHFDTSSVEGVISEVIALNRSATIVIKSTIPRRCICLPPPRSRRGFACTDPIRRMPISPTAPPRGTARSDISVRAAGTGWGTNHGPGWPQGRGGGGSARADAPSPKP